MFELARELSCFDLPIPELSRTLFEEHRFAYLQLLADALQTRGARPGEAVRVDEGEPGRSRARHGVTFEEVEGLIDVLRRTREAQVACVLKQGPDSTWRVSLRSLGSVDVRPIAERQGGGGHRFAAGFTSDESAEAVVAQILNAL